MVSAISRILSLEMPLPRLKRLLGGLRRRPRAIHINDVPDDLLRDIGLAETARPFDPRGEIWRRHSGVSDHLRPGPL